MKGTTKTQRFFACVFNETVEAIEAWKIEGNIFASLKKARKYLEKEVQESSRNGRIIEVTSLLNYLKGKEIKSKGVILFYEDPRDHCVYLPLFLKDGNLYIISPETAEHKIKYGGIPTGIRIPDGVTPRDLETSRMIMVGSSIIQLLKRK